MSASPVSIFDGAAPSLVTVPARRPADVVPIMDADLTLAQKRSRHVERLSLLGTGDERFERITTLAAALFGVPMVAVTLVDSETSLLPNDPGDGGVAGPLPSTDRVFTAHVARSGGPVVIEDATADPRFADLDIVLDAPYLRFFAGVPLDDDDGVTVATFCLYDTVPRRLDHTQFDMLMQLATWARRELVDSTEMSRAREVQESLLPSSTTAPPGFELAAVCHPTKSVGGDFFDHAVVRGRLFLTLVDVMGKGVGAALVAASVRAVLRTSVWHQLRLAERGGTLDGTMLTDIVSDTDALMREDLGHTGTLVTGFAAMIDSATGEVWWIDAGHGLALIVRADGSAERLCGDDLPVGIGLTSTWTSHRSWVRRGDTLLVVSDGLFDLLGGTPASFGKLQDLVAADPDPHRLVERITELTRVGVALDDVTAVALRCDAELG